MLVKKNPGNLSCSQVSATHLMIRHIWFHLWVSDLQMMSCSDLTWHEKCSPSNGHQGDIHLLSFILSSLTRRPTGQFFITKFITDSDGIQAWQALLGTKLVQRCLAATTFSYHFWHQMAHLTRAGMAGLSAVVISALQGPGNAVQSHLNFLHTGRLALSHYLNQCWLIVN